MLVKCVDMPIVMEMIVGVMPTPGCNINYNIGKYEIQIEVESVIPAASDEPWDYTLLVTGLAKAFEAAAKAANNIAVEAVKTVEKTNIIEYDEYVMCEWCDQKATGNCRWPGDTDDKLHDSCGRMACHGYDFEKYASMKASFPFVSDEGVGEMAKALRNTNRSAGTRSAGLAQERALLDNAENGRLMDLKVDQLQGKAAKQALINYNSALKYVRDAKSDLAVWRSIVDIVMNELGFTNDDIMHNIHSGKVLMEEW